ncbi:MULTISPECIES: TetR/AcrR family transcriptional regulator [Streptomyces]|uniref:TetR/AcrR family transcriptional regulator n=1 Tax=Streptomyces arenae TaxID=29301 RepID=UPI001055E930|nr:TetR/AcrR family transcriptional regulator [Streptomyces arenae]MCG7202830.1 TetR/AcrR family transcriptional regulator [Streptomyces arenae]
MVRMSAEERRESVIRAAIAEFSQRGYYGTSTDAIAKRVGVSQPYLFRLFPGKKAIFGAASQRCIDEMREVFEDAAKGLEGEDALHAMGDAYVRLIQERPERLQMQMQTYIAVAAAEAEGEHEFGEIVRAGWSRLWETVHLLSGADVDRTTTFLAKGMLINTYAAMGFPPDHRVWQGMYPDAGTTGRLEKCRDE